jgi:hypothetical protein
MGMVANTSPFWMLEIAKSFFWEHCSVAKHGINSMLSGSFPDASNESLAISRH